VRLWTASVSNVGHMAVCNKECTVLNNSNNKQICTAPQGISSEVLSTALPPRLQPPNYRNDDNVNANVNVEFKVTLHEQVRCRGTLQY